MEARGDYSLGGYSGDYYGNNRALRNSFLIELLEGQKVILLSLTQLTMDDLYIVNLLFYFTGNI